MEMNMHEGRAWKSLHLLQASTHYGRTQYRCTTVCSHIISYLFIILDLFIFISFCICCRETCDFMSVATETVLCNVDFKCKTIAGFFGDFSVQNAECKITIRFIVQLWTPFCALKNFPLQKYYQLIAADFFNLLYFVGSFPSLANNFIQTLDRCAIQYCTYII